MTLSVMLKAGSKREVQIPMKPPLNGYDEVKPRLMEMKAIAQEQLGMVGSCSPYVPFCQLTEGL